MTKPVINSFSELAPLVIQRYERYLPSAFDDSLTMLEKINKVIEYLNQVGELTNDVVEQWNSVMEWVMNEGLTTAVDDQLQAWKDDGTLDTIINTNIFNDLNTDIDEIKKDVGIRLGERLAVETDDTGRFQRALDEIKTVGAGRLLVPSQDTNYIVKTQLDLFEGLIISGQSKDGTVIEYQGASGTALFKDVTNVWGHGVIFEKIYLKGNGSNKDTGTVDGIVVGDITDTGTLYNTPWLRFYDVRIEGFKTGVYLEGYGHTFFDTYVQNCNIGVQIVHPEQVFALNSWVQYCNVGVELNPEIKASYAGHRFTWLGGSIQRNVIGFRAYNTYQIRMACYFELNTQNDVVLGKSTGDYSLGNHGVELDINTTPASVSDCNVSINYTQDVNILLCPASRTAQTVPYVRANGASKYICVTYEKEKTEQTATPFDIQGNALNSTVIRTMYSKKYLDKEAIEEIFEENGSEFARLKGNYLSSRNALEWEMQGGNFVVSSDSASSGFMLFDKRDSANVAPIGWFFPGGNMVNKSTDFETQQSGKGLIVVSPDGLTKKRIRIDNTGAIVTDAL